MKKILALLLTFCLLLACCGCEQTADLPEDDSLPARQLPDVTVENPVSFFSLSLAYSYDETYSLNIYDDGAGGCYVEYVGDYKKVGTFGPAIFHGITAAFEESKLPELNGQSIYEEGESYASMYVEYSDGSCVTADFSGSDIPKGFVDGYEIMDAYFRGLTADLPVYVPQPMVMGEVNADALAALQEILGNSGIENIDAFAISDVPMDGSFCQVLGITDSAGITCGTSCAPAMMTTAYSLMIATVADTASIPAVRADFENNLEWNKWICVSASNALIAHKGNMVICLMASDELYQKTADAIIAAGWSDVVTVTNPGV